MVCAGKTTCQKPSTRKTSAVLVCSVLHVAHQPLWQDSLWRWSSRGGRGPVWTELQRQEQVERFCSSPGHCLPYDDKTVIRMGYGRSYDIGVFGSNFGHAVSQNLPILVHQNINATTTGNSACMVVAGSTTFRIHPGAQVRRPSHIRRSRATACCRCADPTTRSILAFVPARRLCPRSTPGT